MSIPLEKALEMDIFHKCRLLTGEAGLQNKILWVNILEILDDLSHIEPGEFLITTAHGFSTQSESEQQGMIEFFAARKLAAVAIQTGHYLEEIPASFIRFSEEHNIPLIEIPPEVSFKSLTHGLMKALINSEQQTDNEKPVSANGEKLETTLAEMKVIWQRLLDNENPEDLHLEIEKHQIRPYDPCQVMILNLQRGNEEKTIQTGETKHELIILAAHAAAQLFRKQLLPFLIGPYDYNLPLLVQAELPKKNNVTDESLNARRLYDELKLIFPESKIRIGISNVHDHIGKLKQAQDEAEKALQTAELELLENTDLVSYKSMNLYRLILDHKSTETLKSMFLETTAPLLDYDHRCKGALMHTLKVYLQFCSIKKAAETLFIHRHTLRYRLQQIEELTGFDPLMPNDALQLNVGLHIYHYLKASNIQL